MTRAASRLSRRGSRPNNDVGVVSGKASVTDGPDVEMKEKISGLYVLEARDLNHAIRLMSKHPVVRAGGVEIRALVDLAPVVEASREPGRGKNANPARSQRFRVVAQGDGHSRSTWSWPDNFSALSAETVVPEKGLGVQ